MKMQDGEEYIPFLLKTVLRLCPLFTFGFGVNTHRARISSFSSGCLFIYLFYLMDCYQIINYKTNRSNAVMGD